MRDIQTINRIKRMQREFKKEPKLTTFENTNNYNQMVIQKGITFMALCEHHEVGFSGTVTIGYIPKGKVIGLSKMARVVEKFLNPTVLTIQEKATQQIVDYFWDKIKPEGVMVIVKARHGCIAYRGVKKDSETITSSFKGAFEVDKTRAEFLSLLL